MTLPSRPARKIAAGRVAGIFGLRGELKVDASRAAETAFVAGAVVGVRLRSGQEREARIRAVRAHRGRILVFFDGVNDATAAEAYAGAELALDEHALVLDPNEYLDADLIGCTLVDEDGADVATVVGVEHYPGSDMLVVGARRTLIPLVQAFVARVDVAAKRITVTLPPGLLDEREAVEDRP